MRHLVIFLFLIFSVIDSKCQTDQRKKDYYNKIKQFYNCLENNFVSAQECCDLFGNDILVTEEFLFYNECDKIKSEIDCDKEFDNCLANLKNCNSLLFNEFKKMKKIFFQGSNNGNILNVINNSSFYDEGDASSIAIDVKFANGNIIYFYMNKYADEPVYITNIYFSTGESVFNYLGNNEKNYLQRLGIISDTDGYSNIRNKPQNNSKIIWKINKNELFYFTPNSKCNWWKVKSFDGLKNGYIHNSRIAPLGKISDDNKKREIKNKYLIY